jgi:hypothetical protein
LHSKWEKVAINLQPAAFFFAQWFFAQWFFARGSLHNGLLA